MCFKSKVKTPKTNPDAVKAPEPVLIEEPKGVDFGATEDDESKDDEGLDGLKVKKSDVGSKDQGDGSSDAVAADTGTGTIKKPKSTAPIKKALKKVVK
ncbi:hypothetical protein 10P302A_gene0032 [Pseudomonas phage 10P302A]|uniref:Uncharacterized protein n=1 Tax=Pseudomonas phage 10P302A TaxID=3038233 RepID=A0AAF0GPW8_9CAUD|nr:hypothetical protein 10P302A_gene0032 [Pseudomonas phage 10P302A]